MELTKQQKENAHTEVREVLTSKFGRVPTDEEINEVLVEIGKKKMYKDFFNTYATPGDRQKAARTAAPEPHTFRGLIEEALKRLGK